MADKNRNPVEGIASLIGSIGEMAHVFFVSMINAGADRQEATAGMQCFITVYWSDAMNNARKETQDREDESE